MATVITLFLIGPSLMWAPVLGTLPALQQPACLPPAMHLMTEASVRASRFDLPAAVKLLRTAIGCDAARVGEVYVQGLLDARAAALDGGTAESLAPVRTAIGVLERIGRNRPGPPEIARLVLSAAAAAAQTERDEMRLYLESAVRMESIQAAAGQAGAPVVTAAEMAGALWLQVDRYDEARRAYEDAARRLGPTPRILLGLARAAARLRDPASACAGYGAFLERWGSELADVQEVVETRTHLARPECRAPAL